MGNSSSFNTCSRCGSANTLSAKYCYQCGAQLKVPEEPKACSKCGTINTGLSNYCRKCGTVLTSNTLVKYCPQCRRQVLATQQVCDCGYSFVDAGIAKPVKVNKKNKRKEASVQVVEQQVVAPTTAPVHMHSYEPEVAVATMEQPYQPFEANVKPAKATKSKAGGRIGAVISFILILAFTYLMFAPEKLRWGTLYKAVPLFVNAEGVATGNWYDVVSQIITMIKTKPFAFPKDAFTITMYIMVALAVLFMALHLLVALFRIIFGKKGKAKRSNILYLVLFLLTAIGSCLIYFAPKVEFLKKLFLPESGSVSYLIFAIPVYFFLFWFVSLFTKKEKKAKKSSKK